MSRTCLSTSWGVVVADDRFPLVWDANHASVFEDPRSLGVEEIREPLLPALRRAGASHEVVEFWGPSPDGPAVRRLRAEAERRGPDVDMVFEGPTLAVPPGTWRSGR